jgi:mono/diheme cytochrome c family protein
LAKGLNPSAPELQSSDTQAMSDGELFWTVKHGIRMTGMPAFAPTHTDAQIWKIVAFVRHLPNLTPEETAELIKAPAAETPAPAKSQ